jgi:ankyrin repeat protein
MFAVVNCAPEIVRKLVELGADLNHTPQCGLTPLRQAVDCEKPEMIHALAELGADVNEYHPEVGSLLHIAISHQRLSIIPELIKIKVDQQLKDPRGRTPRDLAAANAEARRNIIRELQRRIPNVPAKMLTMFSEDVVQFEKVYEILSPENEPESH